MQGVIDKKYLLFGIPILIIGVAVLVVLVARGNLKIPSTSLLKKKPTVELKTTYENPFSKDTQYVNPFEKYKNPFVTNR